MVRRSSDRAPEVYEHLKITRGFTDGLHFKWRRLTIEDWMMPSVHVQQNQYTQDYKSNLLKIFNLLQSFKNLMMYFYSRSKGLNKFLNLSLCTFLFLWAIDIPNVIMVFLQESKLVTNWMISRKMLKPLNFVIMTWYRSHLKTDILLWYWQSIARLKQTHSTATARSPNFRNTQAWPSETSEKTV